MNESYIRNVLEAAMLAAGKSLTLAELGQLFDEAARPKVEELRAGLDALAAEYAGRGIEVKETAAGFRIQVRRELSGEISRLWPERPARYSRALLETLALIAYRQPITRAEIEAVRGVAVNPNIVKTVIERNWVRVVGHRDVPGRPELLGTTREFLDYFGLRSLDELPPLAELKAMGDYNLQLELPNAGALGIEGKPVEGAAAASEMAPSTEEAPSAVEAVSSDEAGSARELEAASAAPARDDAEPAVAEPDIDVGIDSLSEVAVELSEVAVEVVSSFDVTEAVREDASESDEPETSEASVAAVESSDASEETTDEEADDDELSADGQGTRELVAGPRDHDE